MFELYANEQFKRPLAPEITGSGSGKTPAQLKEQFHWLDIWARRDPVPAGHLDDAVIKNAQVNPKEQVKRRKVINMDSIFLDHSAYWSNKDDCIPRIAEAINTDKPLWRAAAITQEKLTRRIKYASRFRLLTLKLLAQIVVGTIVAGGVVFLILQWANII